MLVAACDRPAPAPAAPASLAAPAAPVAIGSTAEVAFRLEPETINLGTLQPDQDATFEFAVVNVGTSPLQLVNIDGSCECLGFTWDRGPVPAGGRRRVTSSVKAQNRGSKLLTVFVESSHGSSGTRKTLDVSYLVIPELTLNPVRADFGKRLVGSPSTLEIVVSYHQPSDAAPIELKPRFVPPAAEDPAMPTPLRVEVAGEPEIVEHPGDMKDVKQRLLLTLDTTAPVAAFALTVTFDSERHLPAKLPVTGAVHRGWYLDPDQIHLGVVAIGTTRRGASRLLWTREEPRIESIECDPPGLTAELVREDGARSFRVQVTFVPKVAGDLDGTVRIRTNLAPDPLLLRVKGKVR